MRATLALIVAIAFASSAAIADSKVDELAKMSQSSSEKTRLSAVAALARLNDKTALKPLVAALHDPNAQVRALAASALGSLGHKAALVELRKVAADDTDDKVVAAAKNAVKSISKANNIPEEDPATAATKTEARTPGRAGFGHQPRAVTNRPDLYVAINTAADDAPGKHDKAARKQHGELLKKVLANSLAKNPTVTMASSEGSRWGLDLRHLDLSIVKLEVSQPGDYVEVDCQLRFAISDDKGRMMSFVSGGAKYQVKKATFNQAYLPNLRKDAIESAMINMVDKLLAQLRRPNA